MATKTHSGPTHVSSKRFDLRELIIDADEPLDLSDGILRLPERTIRRAIDIGLMLPLDPVSVAKRQIEAEAQASIEAAKEELKIVQAAVHARNGAGIVEIARKFGPKSSEHAAAMSRLAGELREMSAAGQARLDEKLRAIESSRLQKLAVIDQ